LCEATAHGKYGPHICCSDLSLRKAKTQDAIRLTLSNCLVTMSPVIDKRRPIRIGGASGGFTDRVAAICRLASDPDVDAVVGDWLSENVMTGYGAGKERSRRARAEKQKLVS
jgi:hypothetical protein